MISRYIKRLVSLSGGDVSTRSQAIEVVTEKSQKRYNTHVNGNMPLKEREIFENSLLLTGKDDDRSDDQKMEERSHDFEENIGRRNESQTRNDSFFENLSYYICPITYIQRSF